MPEPRLKISPAASTLPSCTPQLMPFHINYTGHAPISTFFRVRKAPSTQPGASLQSDSRKSLKERLLAAFRGRTVHGLEVPVPDGFCGVVLKSDASTKLASTSTSQTKSVDTKSVKGRPTRRTRGKKASDEAKDSVAAVTTSTNMDDPETFQELDVAPQKSLTPSHTFSSVLFWSPDIAVDEGKDEYIRALDEWISLSSEVCALAVPAI